MRANSSSHPIPLWLQIKNSLGGVKHRVVSSCRMAAISFRMGGLNPGVSVIICCHNSAKRLPETLRHLAAQVVPEGIAWEVIVVDNASTDDTAKVALACTSPSLPMRVVFEPQAGLRHARVKGIQEAQYEILSFLDDDNWAETDWVSRISRFFSTHPEIDVCGGRSIAETEIPPPDWFAAIQSYYAVGRQHACSGEITEAGGTLLYGAGLNLRTAAVKGLLESGFVFLMSGREGGNLLAGEDTELCFALRARGSRFWCEDDLCFRHFIARERLQWAYAQRLMLGMGKASIFIDLYLFALRPATVQDYPEWKKGWFFQFAKVLRQAAVTLLTHPVECLSQREGSLAALRWNANRGQLAMLVELAGRYRSTRSAIAAAPWARKFRPESR